MVNTPAPQLFTHHPGQRTALCPADICHHKSGGIQFVPGAHGADELYLQIRAPLGQIQLGRHSINGVHHIVILGQVYRPAVFRQVEHSNGPHPALRIDIPDPPGHHLHFGLSQGRMKRNNLAVQVAL